MSLGTNLLKLQELDLALERDRAALAEMPEIAELARKRRAYQKLKADETRLFAQRKDVETILAELDGREQDCNDDIGIAQRRTDSSNYREVQQLEVDLGILAKQLDKIAFERREQTEKLDEIVRKQEYLTAYIVKFEKSVVADTRAARDKASAIKERIESAERKREAMLAALPADASERYTAARTRFRGLAVERLEGNVPSVCRMALQESSMDELRRAGGVTECPYCHRILVTDAEDEI